MIENPNPHAIPFQEYLAQLRDQGVKLGREIAEAHAQRFIQAGKTEKEACDIVGTIAMDAEANIIASSGLSKSLDADQLVFVRRNIVISTLVGFGKRYGELLKEAGARPETRQII